MGVHTGWRGGGVTCVPKLYCVVTTCEVWLDLLITISQKPQQREVAIYTQYHQNRWVSLMGEYNLRISSFEVLRTEVTVRSFMDPVIVDNILMRYPESFGQKNIDI